jgi:hypothetical protein
MVNRVYGCPGRRYRKVFKDFPIFRPSWMLSKHYGLFFKTFWTARRSGLQLMWGFYRGQCLCWEARRGLLHSVSVIKIVNQFSKPARCSNFPDTSLYHAIIILPYPKNSHMRASGWPIKYFPVYCVRPITHCAEYWCLFRDGRDHRFVPMHPFLQLIRFLARSIGSNDKYWPIPQAEYRSTATG